MAKRARRAPGRPREFRDQDAVASALETFWARGYAGVSITDLEESTGVVRTSLYNAFNSKRGLFDAALDCYLSRLVEAIDQQLTTATSGLDDVHAFLDGLESNFAAGVPGCFMVNSMIEFGDADRAVAERAHRYIETLTRGFRAALGRACEHGEVSPATPLAAIADALVLETLGLNLAARFGLADDRLAELFAGAHATVRSLVSVEGEQ